jgi:hypothetical protein
VDHSQEPPVTAPPATIDLSHPSALAKVPGRGRREERSHAHIKKPRADGETAVTAPRETRFAELEAAVGGLREQVQTFEERWQQRIEREALRVPPSKGVASDPAPRLIGRPEIQPTTPLLAQSPPDRAGGVQDDPGYCLDDDEAVTDKCRRKAHPKTGPPEALDALAYTTVQAARVTGRSHTRIKKAIREKELMARKDGRATILERTELQRWISTLPTIGREPEQATVRVVDQTNAKAGRREVAINHKPELATARVSAKGSAGARHDQAHVRSTPPPRPRSLSNALADNPRR